MCEISGVHPYSVFASTINEKMISYFSSPVAAVMKTVQLPYNIRTAVEHVLE